MVYPQQLMSLKQQQKKKRKKRRKKTKTLVAMLRVQLLLPFFPPLLPSGS
jgi:hypothetical protein